LVISAYVRRISLEETHTWVEDDRVENGFNAGELYNWGILLLYLQTRGFKTILCALPQSLSLHRHLKARLNPFTAAKKTPH
jgi:hypothetical protein